MLVPIDLRCEYLQNPLGIDVTQPRLSWVLASGNRDQAQSGYRILVADNLSDLEASKLPRRERQGF